MSQQELSNAGNDTLRGVTVEVLPHKPQRKKKAMEYDQGVRNDFVYVNSAYVGSLNSVNESRIPQAPTEGVYREQYWACTRWPYGQRILAISVGLLLGAVIGLAVTMVLRQNNNDKVIAGIFSYSVPD